MKNKNINQLELEEVSTKNIYFSIIESLLFVSGEPLDIKQIAPIIECSLDFTKQLLKEMTKLYECENRGIKIINNNENYSLATKADNSIYIEKLLGINSRQGLSQAALETLAIVAYKQPITRVDIDEVRGVKSDRAIYGLIEKGLIKECGRLDVIGRPILYGTTEEFLKYFDLENIDQMPSLDSFMAEVALDREELND